MVVELVILALSNENLGQINEKKSHKYITKCLPVETLMVKRVTSYPEEFFNFLGPRWPSGKVSALGPEGSRFETRFHRRSAVYGARCTLNSYAVAKHPPLVRRGSLERGRQLRGRPRHRAAAQNCEVRPKVALVLLQNRTLIYN
ncbi:hypothetical protein AVEN_191447-1 [Araneus ventricosus]|uniref:Uncharacterized protein n=1 Tax=Araneus ventricosus TaxID=182803 RepID=A0A4Y2L708_ARAVE|nr:hypothetical protein AVEN_191447-1 [Araneus ventricosus]